MGLQRQARGDVGCSLWHIGLQPVANRDAGAPRCRWAGRGAAGCSQGRGAVTHRGLHRSGRLEICSRLKEMPSR
eukprot:scaffold37344_cov55-Phaeocystis_antarctica.AAC.3